IEVAADSFEVVDLSIGDVGDLSREHVSFEIRNMGVHRLEILDVRLIRLEIINPSGLGCQCLLDGDVIGGECVDTSRLRLELLNRRLRCDDLLELPDLVIELSGNITMKIVEIA